MQADPHLANGLNVHEGRITNAAVAAALDLPYTPVADVL
jgi:alanine dehydrogenase